MNTKNILVFLATFVIALAAISVVSAGEITNSYTVEVDNIDAYLNNVSVVAGEKIRVEVYFNSLVDDTDVTIEAELKGQKVKFSEITESFDIESGFAYRKILVLEVPYELKDQVSDTVKLNIEIDGKDHQSDLETIYLNVQRPSYNAVIKSVTTPSSIEAGESFDVEFVLKNMGYNDLDDVYVEVSIPELGISQGPTWVGDLVKIEICDDDVCEKDDTVSGSMTLKVPFGTDEGIYGLEFTVYNDDTESTKVKQIVIKNDFSNEVIAMNTEKDVAVGEEVEFTMLLVNPTDQVRVYTIVVEAGKDVDVDFAETMVAVGAGDSKTLSFSAEALDEGTQEFTVNVFANGDLVDSVEYNLDADGKAVNSTVVLSIILAIIFLVLLVVLIVLLARRPEKNTEEFGESYY
jgi:hypothetical protein